MSGGSSQRFELREHSVLDEEAENLLAVSIKRGLNGLTSYPYIRWLLYSFASFQYQK